MRLTSEQRWSEQVATLQSSLEDARQTLIRAEARFAECKTELEDAEIADKRQLMTQLEECGKREPLVRTVAYEQGMREVWESVRFRGYSTTARRDFWFDDYYYTFEVEVRGQKHKWTVQTKSEETGFAKALQEVFNLISLFAVRK
jgi:hypothetical protein